MYRCTEIWLGVSVALVLTCCCRVSGMPCLRNIQRTCIPIELYTLSSESTARCLKTEVMVSGYRQHVVGKYYYSFRNNSWYGHSQWGTLPLCHWLCPYPEWSLVFYLRLFFLNITAYENPMITQMFKPVHLRFMFILSWVSWVKIFVHAATCHLWSYMWKTIGGRPKSSQSLPGLQTAVYIFR